MFLDVCFLFFRMFVSCLFFAFFPVYRIWSPRQLKNCCGRAKKMVGTSNERVPNENFPSCRCFWGIGLLGIYGVQHPKWNNSTWYEINNNSSSENIKIRRKRGCKTKCFYNEFRIYRYSGSIINSKLFWGKTYPIFLCILEVPCFVLR